MSRPDTVVIIVAVVLLIGLASALILLPRREIEGGATVLVLGPGSTFRSSYDGGSVSVSMLLDDGGYGDASRAFAYLDDGRIEEVEENTTFRADGEGYLHNGSGLIGIATLPKDHVPLLSCVKDLALAGLGLGAPPPGTALPVTERVVIVELDGVGWSTFERSRTIAPNITSLSNATYCLTAWPPMTNVGTAFAITGAPPSENGIRERTDHRMEGRTLFQIAGDAGLRTSWIESDIGFLDAEMTNVPDENGDGTSDDEVLDTAIGRIGEGDDLIMAHFHSYDDAAHGGGASGANATAAMGMLDRCIGRIAEAAASDGASTLLLIFSDHGSPEEGGHGDFRAEDMYSLISWEVLNGHPDGTTVLTVSLDGIVKANLAMGGIRALTRVEGPYSLRSSRSNETNVYEGVPLQDLIALTGMEGPPSGIKLSSSDGYSTSLDPSWSRDLKVVVAYSKDGAPLLEDGPLRLIVPQDIAGEYNAQYCVKHLVSVEVRS